MLFFSVLSRGWVGDFLWLFVRFVENSRADAYPGAGVISRERMLSCLFSVFSANDQVAFVLFGFVFSLPLFWGVYSLNCQVFFGMSITCEKPFSRIDPTLGTATYLNLCREG